MIARPRARWYNVRSYKITSSVDADTKLFNVIFCSTLMFQPDNRSLTFIETATCRLVVIVVAHGAREPLFYVVILLKLIFYAI